MVRRILFGLVKGLMFILSFHSLRYWILTLDLKEKENNYLLKTNLDYTLCKGDRPLLSIEFNGVSLGFSRYGEYVQYG